MATNYGPPFCDALIAETKRRLFEESIPRVHQCLNKLTEAEIWHKPNVNSNSVGNLILHLCGNARQWIVSGLGRQEDKRQRQQEFDTQGGITKGELQDKLEQLQKELAGVLDQVTPDDLLEVRKVQTFEESGLSILVHVVEHFSYHVGQITYYVKLIKDIDTGYYSGLVLET
jgi:uncharacterized damage-inducible protein DinB